VSVAGSTPPLPRTRLRRTRRDILPLKRGHHGKAAPWVAEMRVVLPASALKTLDSVRL